MTNTTHDPSGAPSPGGTPSAPAAAGLHADHRRGAAAGVIAYLVWGLLTLYWRQLHHFDAFELIGWRVTSSAVVMAAVLTVTGGWRALLPVLRRRGISSRVAMASVLLTVNWTSYVYAVVHDHVIETALGYFIAPLCTMAVGVLVLKEQLHRSQVVSIAMALGAVVVLTVSYGRVPYLAFLIAGSWTGYGYLKKRVPLTPVESMAAESLLLVVPALVLIAVRWSEPGSIPSSATAGQLVLVALAGMATVVPLMMFAFSAQRVPLTILAPLQYLVPIINFLLGWLVFHEDLPTSRVIGFALIWCALLVLTVDSTRRARSARAVVAAQAASTSALG